MSALNHLRAAALIVVALSAAGCSRTPQTPVVAPDGIVMKSGKAVAYRLDGRAYKKAAEYLTAAQMRDTTQAAAVAARPMVLRSLRMPAPAGRSPDPVIREAEFRRAAALVQAVKDSGIAREVVADGAEGPVSAGIDAVLTVDAAGGYSLNGGLNGTGQWFDAGTLDDFVAALHAAAAAPSPPAVYGPPLQVIAEMDAQSRAQAAKLRKADAPLPDKVLAVIPVGDAGETPERHAFDRRIAMFMTKADVFSLVEVDFLDSREPAQENFDWVFWRRPGEPEWNIRGIDGKTRKIGFNLDPQAFAAHLQALTRRW